MKFIFISILGLFSVSAQATTPSEAGQIYLDLGRGVQQRIESESPDSRAIQDEIGRMLDLARIVVEAYGKQHEQCAAQLQRLLDLYDQINNWSAREIRLNIERGDALPSAEGCYPARDIVAHPAIVRAISRTGIVPENKTRLLSEMEEAIEHMQNIVQDL